MFSVLDNCNPPEVNARWTGNLYAIMTHSYAQVASFFFMFKPMKLNYVPFFRLKSGSRTDA